MKSELLHESEVVRICHTLYHPVPVFDMSSVYIHPRVEDVPKTVLSQVLHRHHSVRL